MKIVKWIISTVFTLTILGCVVAVGGYYYIKADLPNVDSLKTVELQQPMKIFTADGKLIGEVGEERRNPLPLDEIPKPLIEAVIATEDSRFYEHHGIDPIGIARAVWVAITHGGLSQGGSTITQQVAKNFFLTPERTIIRKIKEAVLAIEIDKALTKDEILQLYLNKIYLGYRSFGVSAAAETYFGKPLKDLSLGELAMIAGLPKAPSTMNPLYSLKRATERRDVVLGRMLAMKKYITQEQYDTAVKQPLVASYHGTQIDLHADYVAEMARREMIKLYGEHDAKTKGYKVFLTINSKDQMAAQDALRNNLIDYSMRHGFNTPARLWGEGSTPLSSDEIIDKLKALPNSEPLVPAAVMAVTSAGAQLLLADGKSQSLPWSAMSWSKATFTNGKISVGQQIWIRQLSSGAWQLAQVPEVNSAMVSLNSYNGAIEALVGGFSYERSNFNRATQSLVQVGSSIKPFIYAAALNKGLTPATILLDKPITVNIPGQQAWRPKNAGNNYQGPLRLRIGLAQSRNVMMVRTVRMIGMPYISDFLQRFGFNRGQYAETEALALGAASFTPMEMARGYAVFDNGGYLVTPYLINTVEDADGKVIYQADPQVACFDCTDQPVIYGKADKLGFLDNKIDLANQDDKAADASVNDVQPETVPDVVQLQASVEKLDDSQAPSMLIQSTNNESKYAPHVISSGVAFIMRDLLHSAVYGEVGSSWRGTGWSMGRSYKRSDIGGKTGTTNNNKVAWYSGFGANYVTSAYVSFDGSKALGKYESGGRTALPEWEAYMKVLLSGIPQRPDPMPASVIQRRIDKKTGLLSNSTDDKDSRLEYFLQGTEPTRYAVVAQGYQISLPATNSTGDETKGQPVMQELF